MRFLIFLLLIYLGYRSLRRWMETTSIGGHTREENRPPKAVDDIMIKDPFCGTYFPKRDGVRLHFEGKDYHFCSPQCRDDFLAQAEATPNKDNC